MSDPDRLPAQEGEGWLEFYGTFRSRVKVQGRYTTELRRSLDLLRVDDAFRAWWGEEHRVVRVYLAFNDHREEWGSATNVRMRKDHIDLTIVLRADLMTAMSGDELIRAAQDDLYAGLALVAQRLKKPAPTPLPAKVLRTRRPGDADSGLAAPTPQGRGAGLLEPRSHQATSPVRRIVEIHVPLTPPPDPTSAGDPYPWIDEVGEFLAAQDGGDMGVYGDGEEHEAYYVFCVTGGTEDEMLDLADRVAGLPGVPAGVVAFVAEDESDAFGSGRRVQLPHRGQEPA